MISAIIIATTPGCERYKISKTHSTALTCLATKIGCTPEKNLCDEGKTEELIAFTKENCAIPNPCNEEEIKTAIDELCKEIKIRKGQNLYSSQ